MANRNKTAGSNWERRVVSDIASVSGLTPYNGKNEAEAEIGTTRVFSKAMDNQGIDIWFKETQVPIYLQCKSLKTKPSYDLLKDFDTDGIRAILHRHTKKSPKGRFMTQGEYAILPYEDFLKLLEYAEHVIW